MTGFGSDLIPGLPSEGSPASAPHCGAVVLRVLNGPQRGREYRVDGLQALLGRSDPPDFVADIDLTACEVHPTPVISRRHAEIRIVADRLQLVALQDRNGTFLNGERIVHGEPGKPSLPVELHSGDKVTVADLELEVICNASQTG